MHRILPSFYVKHPNTSCDQRAPLGNAIGPECSRRFAPLLLQRHWSIQWYSVNPCVHMAPLLDLLARVVVTVHKLVSSPSWLKKKEKSFCGLFFPKTSNIQGKCR